MLDAVGIDVSEAHFMSSTASPPEEVTPMESVGWAAILVDSVNPPPSFPKGWATKEFEILPPHRVAENRDDKTGKVEWSKKDPPVGRRLFITWDPERFLFVGNTPASIEPNMVNVYRLGNSIYFWLRAL